MPTPKGLMPNCLARMGRKGVTGAAAEKRRKKWPCDGRSSFQWRKFKFVWKDLLLRYHIMIRPQRSLEFVFGTGRDFAKSRDPGIFRDGIT